MATRTGARVKGYWGMIGKMILSLIVRVSKKFPTNFKNSILTAVTIRKRITLSFSTSCRTFRKRSFHTHKKNLLDLSNKTLMKINA